MRIAALTRLFPEPGGPFVLEKLAALADRGHDVHVIAEPSDDAAPWGGDGGNLGLTIHRSPVRATAERVGAAIAPALVTATARDPRFVRSLTRALRAQHGLGIDFWLRMGRTLPLAGLQPDVVHFEWATWAVGHLEVLPLLGCPSVVSCRGSDLRVAPLRSIRLRERLPALFAAVDCVHCVSHELAEQAIGYGARPEQIFVAPSGADTGFFATACGPRPDDGVTRIVSAGRLHWVKGYKYALQAVDLLRKRGHPVLYTIAGEEDGGGGEVRFVLRELGLEGVVTLTGHLEQAALRSAFASSDIFLLSSVSEGVSVAAAQAMASGLPVVVTDVGGMGDAVIHGAHGFVVPPRDPTALADALERLIVDPEPRRAAGQRAADHARHHLDLHGQVDRLVAVYEDLRDRSRHGLAKTAAS